MKDGGGDLQREMPPKYHKGDLRRMLAVLGAIDAGHNTLVRIVTVTGLDKKTVTALVAQAREQAIVSVSKTGPEYRIEAWGPALKKEGAQMALTGALNAPLIGVDTQSIWLTGFIGAHRPQSESLGQSLSIANYITMNNHIPDICWPKARDVARLEDMSPNGHLRVLLDRDNDVRVEVFDGVNFASVEFCNTGSGGGQSSRTWLALIDLMRSIEADNAARPARAHPRNAG